MLRDQIGQRVYPVHRLDKPTSGVLLFALDRQTARQLGERFTLGKIAKTYLAVVRGITETEGLIDYPLTEDLDRMTDTRARRNKRPQPATTGYRRLAEAELPFAVGRYPTSRYSLIEAYPRNGRKHQIRRHLKHIFHPLIGDTKHGEGKHNRFFREQFGCHRLLLAATELSLVHPRSGEVLTLVAPLDATFTSLLEQMGWRDRVPNHWLGRSNGSE